MKGWLKGKRGAGTFTASCLQETSVVERSMSCVSKTSVIRLILVWVVIY